MERYIDAELAKEALTGWETDPLDEEIERAIDNIPTADVVPRAEIESILKYSKDTIKTEVAREIFEEVDKIIISCREEEYSKEFGYIVRQSYNGKMIIRRLDSLKKKYTEGET